MGDTIARGIAYDSQVRIDKREKSKSVSIYTSYPSVTHIEERAGIGNPVYIYFDKIAVRDVVYNDISWSDVKTMLPNATFGTSYSGKSDYLVLGGTEALVFDIDANKLELLTTRYEAEVDKHIVLALNISGIAIQGLLVDERNAQSARVVEATPKGETLPTYAIEDIESTNQRVQSVQTAETLSFGFMTDSHYTSDYAVMTEVLDHFKAINTMSDYCGLDFIGHGGDFCNGYTPLDISKIDLSKGVKTFIDGVNAPVMIAKGNHDDSSYYSVSHPNGANSLSEVLTEREWYTHVVKLFENEVVLDSQNPEGGYFYKDFEKQKIRVIMLNSTDIPLIENGDGTIKYAGIHDYGFRNKQLNFVAHEALNFDSKTNASEWEVQFICHVPPLTELTNSGLGTTENGQVMVDIIQAFKNGTSYTSTTTSGDFAQSVSVDFTTQGAKTVISFLNGHVHVDDVNVINGINYVSCLNAYAVKNGSSLVERTSGTDTEDSWTIFTIDKNTRTVYGHRYGAGNDFQFTY